MSVKNDLLRGIENVDECGPIEIFSELISSTPYTRIAVSKPNKKKSKSLKLSLEVISPNFTAKHEKMVQRIQNNIAQDINNKVVRQLHTYYNTKINALESTINVLQNGVETKNELDRIKSVFKQREADLQAEIDDLKNDLIDCKATVENKEKVITMLNQCK